MNHNVASLVQKIFNQSNIEPTSEKAILCIS